LQPLVETLRLCAEYASFAGIRCTSALSSRRGSACFGLVTVKQYRTYPDGKAGKDEHQAADNGIEVDVGPSQRAEDAGYQDGEETEDQAGEGEDHREYWNQRKASGSD
jgi:hypothetical protein